MTELVTAVFEASSMAEAAIQDLEMARIPSVVIQRGVSGDRDGNASTWHSVADAWHNTPTAPADLTHCDGTITTLRSQVPSLHAVHT